MKELKYSYAQRLLHWVSACLIAFMALTGMAYYLEWSDDLAINAHQIVGQTLIIFVIWRIIVRWRQGVGAGGAEHSLWEQRLAMGVHMALYAALLVYLTTGYVSASALRDNMLAAPMGTAFARSDLGEQLLEVHYAMKWVLLGLVGLHIAAVLKHQFWDKDDTFSQIWFHKG